MTTSFATEAISPRPLHSVVAEKLRELIVGGELAPGERLNETKLTQRFNISRTPVRDAIKILAGDGLVKLMPNRGAVVTAITRSEAQDLFQVMAVLEAVAGELACERATDADIAEVVSLHDRMRKRHRLRDLAGYFALNQQIHEKIVQCAQNTELANIYNRLSVRVRGARYMANFDTERWDAAMREHEYILAALAKRDSEKLKSLLLTHLTNKFVVIQAWLSERGGPELELRPVVLDGTKRRTPRAQRMG